MQGTEQVSNDIIPFMHSMVIGQLHPAHCGAS